MAFDVAGAKAAGYSDTEIVDHLASERKFNVSQARAAGYSDAELMTHLAAGPSRPKLAPEDTPGFLKTVQIGAGRTFDKVLDGMTQAWMGVNGDTDSTKAALKQSVDDKSRLYQPLADARPVATAIGESLPSMVVPVGGTAGVLATSGKLAAAGALPNALEYGTAEERLKHAAVGAAGNVVGGVVAPKVLGALGSGASDAITAMLGKATPEAAALFNKAKTLGIDVNAAQLGDSKFMKYLASMLESVPFTGQAAKQVQQKAQFNRAVSRTFGEDSPVVTAELYNTAKKRITGEFDRLTSQNELKVTPSLLQDMGSVTTDAAKHGTDASSKSVTNLVDELMAKMDPATGTIPGQAYQSLDSKIGRLLKGGGEQTPYLRDLQDALRTAMDHSISKADQEAWMTARSQYKNLKAVRDIVAKDGADGNISPAALMARLNSTQAGKETMAQGTRGELQDVAKVGKQFVADHMPNSGTVQRTLAMGAIGGGGYMAGSDPGTLAGLALTGLTSGRLASRVLSSPRVTARMVGGRSGQSLSDIVASNPSLAQQVVGGGAGMTLADLANR